MNRRDWLRTVAALAPATAMSSHLADPKGSDQLLIVTDTPEQVIQHLRPNLPSDVLVDVRRVTHSLQEVTIVRSGVIIDPRVAPRVDSGIRDLHGLLRRRQTPATHLVSISRPSRRTSEVAVFEQNGRTVERVDRTRSYRHIEIHGTLGSTVFSLQQGQLSVVRSSCRHELCRKSGPIRSGRIVCVPNRLVASIAEPAAAYDAMTG